MGTHARLTWRLGVCFAVCTVGSFAGCTGEVESMPDMPRAEEPAVTDSPVVEQREAVPLSQPARRHEGGGLSGAVINARRQAQAFVDSEPIDHAIRLYHASNGRYPKSHEEFMKQVMEPNHMRLPEAEEGYELRYNPEDHRVWQYPIEPEQVEEPESP